jgi:hypothetical protein
VVTLRARAAFGHGLLVFGGYLLLFSWLLSRSLFGSSYLAQSDLYEYFLPLFLSPLMLWSRYEFGGLPAFADGADNSFYPIQLVARALHVWEVAPLAAYVLASSFTYAYVFQLTRKRAPAAIAGLAYGLSEALVGRLPHLGVLHTFAWFPFLLLAIDKIRETLSPRWIGLGAIGSACFFLAGHPQPAVYGLYVAGLYAVIVGWPLKASLRYYVAVAAMIVLGLVLAAVKILPVAEGSLHMARQVVSFSQFAGHAPAFGQLPAVVFPALPHDPLEQPLYLGVVPLSLALLCCAPRRTPWRVWFWIAIALTAFVVALGEATPLSRVAYHLPLYDKFRIATRHLFLVAFATAVLAGMAAAALEEATIRFRSLFATSGVLLLALVAIAVAIPGDSGLRLQQAAAQVGLAATVPIVATLLLRGHRTIAAMALVCLVVVDLLHAAPYPLTFRGIDAPVVAKRAAGEPSVHASTLARAMSANGQRLLALGGTHLDAVVPAAFARVWKIPIAGGYGPMLLERHRQLALMGTNGETDPAVLAGDDSALDVLAVRYVLLRAKDYSRPPFVDVNSPAGRTRPLEWTIGRPDCGFPYPRRSALPLASGVSVRSITLVAYMRCGEHVPQGSLVATLRASDDTGGEHVKLLRAGQEIADLSVEDPQVRARAKHRSVERADRGYIVRWAFGAPARLTQLSVDAAGFGGWITIDHVTLTNDSGGAIHLEAPWIYLQDTTRWREVMAFRTSRTSDRGSDEDAAGETNIRVFENQRARPRAWIVPEIIEASEQDMIAAVHQAQLPDGRRFDPARVAIVDRESGETTHFNSAAASARVSDAAEGRIDVDVASDGGGFLVLSEAFYPGWTARIGERRLLVRRVNVSLQGVVVPPGRHTVTFEFSPSSFWIGAALTTLGLIAVLALISKRR